MEFDLPKNSTKYEVITSNVFVDETKVACECLLSLQYNMYSDHDNPVEYAIRNMNLIEECIEFIVPNKDPKNSIVRQIKDMNMIGDLDEPNIQTIREKICGVIKDNWEDIDGIDPEHFIYDKYMSRFDLIICLDTSIEQIKSLDKEVLDKWDYTVYTPFGEFEILE